MKYEWSIIVTNLIEIARNGFFFEFSHPYFLISLLLISVISFLDDIYTISSKWRFLVQLIAAVLLIVELFNPLSFYCLLLIPVLVGVLNGYNFMDGIKSNATVTSRNVSECWDKV